MKQKIAVCAFMALASPLAWGLIGGKVSDMFPEVVRLQAGKKVCTGTIVGPRAVLSAAHCVTASADDPHFVYNGKTYRVTYFASPESSKGHDIALAITNEKIKNARFAHFGNGIKHGMKITMAGFGCTKKGGVPGLLHIGSSLVIGMDQDHILSALPGGGVLCEGDSGGPSFANEGNERRLVAVSSLSDIAKININVRTDSALSYAFFKAASIAKQIEICGINAECN